MTRGEPVPELIRLEVIRRDASTCRICGRFDENVALHHIDYRSQGGSNEASNLISLGWLPSRDCHISVVHAHKRLWQPICHFLTTQPSVTGMQVLRQLANGVEPEAFGLDEVVGVLAASEYQRLRAKIRA